MKKTIIHLLRRFNYEIINTKKKKYPFDFDETHKEIVEKTLPFTLTSIERLYGLIEAVKYVHQNKIEGDIVECGVWKGGSMMAATLTFAKIGDTNRKFFLYDTYEGMPAATSFDEDFKGTAASELLTEATNSKEQLWASSLEEVKANLASTKYPQQNITYVVGKVEETIPATIPEKIALLRLDTDWYESTKHEMEHLFPRLVPGGVIIIDDFGYWKGARKAIEEYIQQHNIKILLNRMDETGRIAIKI